MGVTIRHFLCYLGLFLGNSRLCPYARCRAVILIRYFTTICVATVCIHPLISPNFLPGAGGLFAVEGWTATDGAATEFATYKSVSSETVQRESQNVAGIVEVNFCGGRKEPAHA